MTTLPPDPAATQSSPSFKQPNPFLFPSNIDFLFALLVLAVLAISAQLFSGVIYYQSEKNQQDYLSAVQHCYQAYPDSADPESILYMSTCTGPIQLKQALWTSAGLLAQLIVVAAIYLLYPAWIIRRQKLVRMTREDLPEPVAALEKLAVEAGLKHMPEIYLSPLDGSISGMAFGRAGRCSIKLTGGLVGLFYTRPEAFRAVLLHELAHIRNADIDKTYLTQAFWYSFLLTALLPNLLLSLKHELFFILENLARTAVLVLVVLLIRNGVLRMREYYADLRAAQNPGVIQELKQIIGRTENSEKKALLPLFRVHPASLRRLAVLDDTRSLFQIHFWIAVAVGIIVGLSYKSLGYFLMNFTTTHIGLMWMLTGFILTPLVVTVVGLGIWRSMAARLLNPGFPIHFGRLAIGLAGGIWLGNFLSFYEAIRYQIIPPTLERVAADFMALAVFDLLWVSVLALSLYLFLRWVAAGAGAWLETALQVGHLKTIYWVGTAVAIFILSAWFGAFFSLVSVPQELNTVFYSLLAAPLAFLYIVMPHPLTVLALFALWSYPLLSLLHLPLPTQDGSDRWSLPHTPLLLIQQTARRRLPLSPILAAFSVGTVYLLLSLLIRLALPTILSPALTAQDNYKIGLYVSLILFSIPFQMLAAAWSAARSTRLRIFYGLASAFLTGLFASAALLTITLLLGGSLDLQFVWTTAAYVLVSGGIFALPAAATGQLLPAGRRRAEQPAALRPVGG